MSNQSKFFDIIKKIDYILLLIGSCLGIIFFGVLIFEEIGHRFHRRQPPQIAVVEAEDKSEIREYVEFCSKVRDVFVFGVKSTAVKAEELYSVESQKMSALSNIAGKGTGFDGITNFIFINESTHSEYKLFPKNVFVYKYSFMTDNPEPYIRNHQCNIYAVIRSDTNGDKVLNSRDNISLFISDYDGRNVKELSAAIMSFDYTAQEEFVFTEYDGSQLSYFVCDCRTRNKRLLKTVDQKPMVKRINL